MIFEGLARRFQQLRSGKNQTEANFTHLEALRVAQIEAQAAERARAGMNFSIAYNGSAPTGIAPVQALPTTAAQWAIWNADPVKSYVFDALGAFPLSGTPGIGGQLLGCFFTTPASTGANATGIVVASRSNGGPASKAIIKSAVTIATPTAGLWFPIAENLTPNVGAFPGSGLIVNRVLNGDILLPPNMGLGLSVLALAGTTPLFGPLAEWSEYAADIE